MIRLTLILMLALAGCAAAPPAATTPGAPALRAMLQGPAPTHVAGPAYQGSYAALRRALME